MRTTRLLPVIVLLGCSSAQEGPGVMELRAPAWVADATAGWDPIVDPMVVRATGRAAMGDDSAAAQHQAEAIATASLRAFVVQAIARLHAVFAERYADLMAPETLAALMADTKASARILDASLAGVQLKGQWSDDRTYFVWLELDTEAFLLPAFQAELGTRLAAQSRELTGADQRAFYTALSALVADQQQH